MKPRLRTRVGAVTFAVVLTVSISARATIVDDLSNLINTVSNLLGQAKSSAKAAAQNSYNTLDSALRTSGNSVTNVAAAARQSAYDSRNNINQLVNNSLVINPQDVTAPLQGLLDCIGGIQTAAAGTASSLNLITAAKQAIASELNAAKAAAPIGSTTAATAVKAVQTAVSEADVLSQRVQAWSTALSMLAKESNDVVLATQQGRCGDLQKEIPEMQQAQASYQNAWSQLQAQATKTGTALAQARTVVQAAKGDAGLTASHLSNVLDQAGKIVGRVAADVSAFRSGYDSCVSAVSRYVTAWNSALASAKQRFLDSLTQEQRDAIANLSNKIAQVDALVTSIGAAVTAALSAALNVVNTAESAISNAVSASITAFMKFLQGFLTHVWDLNMTQLQADLNNLTATIALEVAKVANAVITAANPKKAEAETQLATLTGISGQLAQLHQQLNQASSRSTVTLRAGFTLVQPRTVLLSPLKFVAVSTTSIQTTTAAQLNATLTTSVQTLSKSVYEERLRRKLPVQ
jgi:hypothetical protein